jgi:beta-glucosidase
VDIRNIINQLTLEEKASLCSLKNFWQTQDIERLGIPSITLTDGPYGVAKRLSGFSDVIPSTCFPTSSALSSSWDVDLIYSVGEAIGEECQAEDVQILLGPAMNIQRTPLGGRNFEYYSEDPVLSGEIAASFIQGLQSQGIGACVKHYLANNQEYHRQIINNIIDAQALNEIYLHNFEIAVKKGNPLAAMAAYNSVNGTPCSENTYFLTDVLRNEWNFDGLVISDWFGINSIVDALNAGVDLEAPYSYGINSKNIIEAVLTGILDVSVLDKAVEDILNVVFKVTQDKKENATYDKGKHNDLAREAAENSMVLLKNKHNILPLKKEKLKNKKIAIIGEYAKEPKYQGKGSSEVTPTMLESAYDEINKLVGNSIKLHYSKGYNTSDEIIDDDEALLRDSKKIAKESDVVILFVGTSKSSDSEDIDRKNIDLPDNQIKLIKEIGKIHKNVIVVLSNGSPVSISPWGKYVDAILEAWLAGQASGGAITDILFGIVTPSGKLSSTFPIKLSDIPTYLDYVDPGNNLEYKEGIFVGYRYYDKKNMEVEFPFGFGLSYTTFAYSDLVLNKDVVKDNDTLEVKLKIKNTGRYFGKEIIQLYIKNLISTSPKPKKELKAFTKVALFPGEEKEVSFILNTNDFSHYDMTSNNWVAESGPYEILVGKSSRDIVLSKNLYVQSSYVPKIAYTQNTLMGDFLKNPTSKPIIEPFLIKAAQNIMPDEIERNQFLEYLKSIPIRKLIIISQGTFTDEMLADLLKSINK